MALKDLLRDAKRRAPISVVQAVNRFIVLREHLPSFRETDVWHPSELVWGFCPRQRVLMKREEVEWPEGEVNVELMRIFDIGHALHQWYQERYLGPARVLWGKWRCSRCHAVVEGTMPESSCKQCQWHTEKERYSLLTPFACQCHCDVGDDMRLVRGDEKVASRGGCNHCGRWGRWEYLEPRVRIEEQNISGKADGLLVEGGSPDTVLEVKTANSRSYGARRVVGPSVANVKQIMLYMHGLGKKKGLIVYVSKNDGQIHEVEVKYDRAVIEPELANAALCEKAMQDEKEPLPPRIEACKSMRSPPVKGCPVGALCMGCRS